MGTSSIDSSRTTHPFSAADCSDQLVVLVVCSTSLLGVVHVTCMSFKSIANFSINGSYLVIRNSGVGDLLATRAITMLRVFRTIRWRRNLTTTLRQALHASFLRHSTQDRIMAPAMRDLPMKKPLRGCLGPGYLLFLVLIRAPIDKDERSLRQCGPAGPPLYCTVLYCAAVLGSLATATSEPYYILTVARLRLGSASLLALGSCCSWIGARERSFCALGARTAQHTITGVPGPSFQPHGAHHNQRSSYSLAKSVWPFLFSVARPPRIHFTRTLFTWWGYSSPEARQERPREHLSCPLILQRT